MFSFPKIPPSDSFIPTNPLRADYYSLLSLYFLYFANDGVDLMQCNGPVHQNNYTNKNRTTETFLLFT